MKIKKIFSELSKEIQTLTFSEPVTHVYNPLEYARKSHDLYLSKYGKATREVILLGMNPGPFGMAQTGVPFGEVAVVRDWLGIESEVGTPPIMHPKRPIEGFECQKSEVSGRRLWGWVSSRFENPEHFFERYFVANYCPLLFMEESGRNRTPDKLPKAERNSLFAACDKALQHLVDYFQPKYVIGVGVFAEKRASTVLKQSDVQIGRITHPSPANPKANKGWAKCIEQELIDLGIEPSDMVSR